MCVGVQCKLVLALLPSVTQQILLAFDEYLCFVSTGTCLSQPAAYLNGLISALIPIYAYPKVLS